MAHASYFCAVLQGSIIALQSHVFQGNVMRFVALYPQVPSGSIKLGLILIPG